MIDFGYGISPSSAINLDKFDRTRFEELAREEPDVLKCMACGSCAASCPTAGHSDMNLRKVILLLGRGREDEALRMVSHARTRARGRGPQDGLPLYALRQMPDSLPPRHQHQTSDTKCN